MKILLTGGTGFIGSYILLRLHELGHQMHVFARNINKVPKLHELENVSFTQGDLADSHLFAAMLQGQDACIHVALNYDDSSATNMLLADTLPAVQLAEAAAHAGVKNFIYTSSTAVNDLVYSFDHPRIQGGKLNNVSRHSKQQPVTYYGATKAATENFIDAIGYQSHMHVNFVRPGYTFGNPVVDGASMYGDKRFINMVQAALHQQDIDVIKNDGTQFIWAGDLAELYVKILQHNPNHQLYFGLARNFISWEAIAAEIIRQCHSSSKINVIDHGWSDDVILFDVADMQRDFNLAFNSWPKLTEHIHYLIQKIKEVQ